jgi:hypothetical protein
LTRMVLSISQFFGRPSNKPNANKHKAVPSPVAMAKAPLKE